MFLLETKRCILKFPEEDHLKHYQKIFNNWEIIRHLGARVPWPYPDNGVEEFFNILRPKNGKDEWFWGIFLKTNPDVIIGGIHLRRGTGEYGNRGFWLDQNFWNQGIMSEVSQRINDHAFNDLGFTSLRFSNAKGNIASRRVKEKTGGKYLYTEPFDFVDPELTHHEVWELRKEDWIKSEKL